LHGFNPNGIACVGPCAANCSNNDEPYSFHIGGINAVFGDGSVRFISEGIPLGTMSALITMRGGEVVTGDF
jgi:prepilin-type processing-associated H-X9-DG protein